MWISSKFLLFFQFYFLYGNLLFPTEIKYSLINANLSWLYFGLVRSYKYSCWKNVGHIWIAKKERTTKIARFWKKTKTKNAKYDIIQNKNCIGCCLWALARLKAEKSFKTHREVACLLLDRFVPVKLCKIFAQISYVSSFSIDFL